MNRSTPFLLTALMATLLFTPRVFGQVRNTNQSRRLGCTVAGGWGNVIRSNAYQCSIGGGYANQIGTNNARYATVAGGSENEASYTGSTVSGGSRNKAFTGSTVCGGYSNKATGYYATVAGGSENEASGRESFAAGLRAKAIHDNSFAWSSGNNGVALPDFESFTTNTFNVRASGGVRFDNTTSVFFGNATRQTLNLYDQSYAIGVQTNAEYFRSGDSFYWFQGGVHNNTKGDAGGGTVVMFLDSGGVLHATLAITSDRNVKQDIRPLDAKTVLQKVASLPVTEWSYKASPGTRHYGPMAQDFRAAFGVGIDDKTITSVDADGVALASIKGLVEELKERDKAIDKLKEENKNLSRSIEKINERLNSLPPAPDRD